MRVSGAIATAAVYLLAMRAFASDVDYQLQIATSTTIETPNTIVPPALVIADRVWVTPGVEQSLKGLPPSPPLDARGPQKTRIEAAPRSRWPVSRTEFVADPPAWLDDAVWPLTRELWSNAEFELNMPVPSTPIPSLPPRGFHGMNLAMER
jgi:hypothetical protein